MTSVVAPDDFGRVVLRRAVAQILFNMHFHDVQTTAADQLVDVLQKYIQTCGLYAAEAARAAQHPHVTVHDVLFALSSMRVGLADIRKQLRQEEHPLPFEVPPFPMAGKRRRLAEAGGGDGRSAAALAAVGSDRAPRPPFVPAFLPRYPPLATYVFSAPTAAGEDDTRLAQRDKHEQYRQVQDALNKIDREAGGGVGGGGAATSLQQNPFLLPVRPG
jgi:hypothetical protein